MTETNHALDIYAIQLPDVLPPTYKGRALQFSYELVVGTCRAGTPISTTRSPEGTRENSISRVMKVPIRVYNHVAGASFNSFVCVDVVSSDIWVVNRSPRPYDMLWPVSRNQLPLPEKGRDKGIPETQGNVVEASGLMTERAVHLSPRTCFPIFRTTYINQLRYPRIPGRFEEVHEAPRLFFVASPHCR